MSAVVFAEGDEVVPIITPEDLAPFTDAPIPQAKAAAMIADALAMAYRVAPCLKETEDPDVIAAAKAIIRGAILRWNEAGTGALSSKQQQAGPFGQTDSIDTRQQRRGMYFPSEINDLAGLCADAMAGRAWENDLTPQGDGQDGFWQHPDVWVPLT